MWLSEQCPAHKVVPIHAQIHIKEVTVLKLCISVKSTFLHYMIGQLFIAI